MLSFALRRHIRQKNESNESANESSRQGKNAMGHDDYQCSKCGNIWCLAGDDYDTYRGCDVCATELTKKNLQLIIGATIVSSDNRVIQLKLTDGRVCKYWTCAAGFEDTYHFTSLDEKIEYHLV